MGNYISCTSAGHPKSTRVIFPSGEIRRFHQPLNAAELMLETPNHFLTNSHSLQAGRRFSALPADEDLEMGDLYVMFPMRRVNSVVKPSDMVGLLMAVNASVRRESSTGKARISSEFGGHESVEVSQESEVPRLNMDDKEEGDGDVGAFKVRCRSWKPLLESIPEEIL